MNSVIWIVGGYLFLLVLIAFFVSRKESLKSYLLNKQQSGLWILTFSSIVSMFGAGAVVTVVAEVYDTGISFGLALPISYIIGLTWMVSVKYPPIFGECSEMFSQKLLKENQLGLSKSEGLMNDFIPPPLVFRSWKN